MGGRREGSELKLLPGEDSNSGAEPLRGKLPPALASQPIWQLASRLNVQLYMYERETNRIKLTFNERRLRDYRPAEIAWSIALVSTLSPPPRSVSSSFADRLKIAMVQLLVLEPRFLSGRAVLCTRLLLL